MPPGERARAWASHARVNAPDEGRFASMPSLPLAVFECVQSLSSRKFESMCRPTNSKAGVLDRAISSAGEQLDRAASAVVELGIQTESDHSSTCTRTSD